MFRQPARIVAALGIVAALAACTPTSPSDPGPGTTPAATSSAQAPVDTPASASALVSKMRTALHRAEWGTMKIAGFAADGKPLLMEYTGRVDGTNTRSSMLSGGVETRIMTVGSDTYMSGNVAFWAKNGQPAEYAKKWKLLSPANAAKVNEVQFDDMLLNLFDPNWEVRLSQKVEPTQVDGKRAWTIAYKEGPQEGTITIDAATNLPVMSQTQDSTGTITFTGWNVPQQLNAVPADADLIKG